MPFFSWYCTLSSFDTFDPSCLNLAQLWLRAG
jgi:hypothetical protein